VRRLVLREGLLVAVLGSTVGLAGAMMAGPMLRGLLFELSPLDPLALASAAILVIGASVAACCVPALRASRVDPLAALRHD
jgi:ABC-type antimicrobial peptide transport system permease subunit